MTRCALLAMVLALTACDEGRRPEMESGPDAAGPDLGQVGADAAADEGVTADASPDPGPDATPRLDAEPDAEPDADGPRPDAAPDDAQAPPPPDAGADAKPEDAGPDPADPCPFDVPPDALRLVSGVPHDGVVCRDGSAWFAMDVPAGHELTVLLEFTHADADLDVRLFAEDDLRTAVDASAGADDRERVGLAIDDVLDRPALVEVYGYRGVPGAFRITGWLLSRVEQVDVETSGRVTYADRPYDADGFTGERPIVPARRVVVQARRAFDGAVVAETLTDVTGAYTLRYRGRAQDAHTVEALAEARVAQLSGRARERDSQAVYAVVGEALTPEASPAELDLHAEAGSAAAGAFNIADVVGEALAFITPYTEEGAPTLNVNWTPGRAYACGSCYGNDAISLGGQLEDTDEFDDAIILHEFGHWFVDHFSHDDSPGGSHRDRQVSPTLAYGEGLAYFFAAMVRDAPDIVDTFIDARRLIDLEAVTQNGEARPEMSGTTTGTETGRLREEVVGGVMWDAYDAASAAEPFDTVEIGADGHMAIFVDVFGARRRPADVGARGTDLADWIEALACDVGAEATQPLVDDRAFPWVAEGCAEKGRVPTPFALEARGGRVWLVPEPGAELPPLRVHVLDGQKRVAREVECEGVCVLAPADPGSAVVVGAPGQAWAGASWLGKAFAARLVGGAVGDGVRRYRSGGR